jgi:hypothetical protein
MAYLGPTSQNDTIGQAYYANVPDPSSITRLGKLIRDLSLFNIDYALLNETISSSHAHTNDTTSSILEQLNFCLNLKIHTSKVKEGTVKLSDYLSKNRSRLDAKDVNGKNKHYTLLYSCQLLAKEVLNDDDSSKVIKAIITTDVGKFNKEAFTKASSIGSSPSDLNTNPANIDDLQTLLKT